MTITIEIAPEFQAELARQAATRGVGIDAYAARLIESASRLHNVSAVNADGPRPPAPSREVTAAIETLKGFGKAHGLSLGGRTIGELPDAAPLNRTSAMTNLIQLRR